MKQGYTHIALILDRTGSMEEVKKETITGFNVFLEDQQKQPGEATMTLVQFDSQDPYEILHDFKPLKDIKRLTGHTYVPRGMTPLLDAIGAGIEDVGTKLEKMSEADRPDRIVFVILTDGQENASHKFTRSKVFEMIKHQKDKYNWKFVFLGANQDAINEAATLGVNGGNALTFAANSAGIKCAFTSLSSGMSQYRSSAVPVADMSYFSSDDRQQQESALSK